MISEDIYPKLLATVSMVGADLTDECELFFENELASFSGSAEDFVVHARTQIHRWFRCVAAYPEWLQNAEWQFDAGKPMMFTGQLAVPRSSGLFHDDAAIFVFVNPSGIIRTVLQIN